MRGQKRNLITQSSAQSKVTQKELIDKLSDYHIKYRHDANIIFFDPKNDDRKIIAGGKGGGVWVAIQDSEGWAKFIKEYITSDGEIIRRRSYTGETIVREIWGRDNQYYGFVMHPQGDSVRTRLVEENTLRLSWSRPRFGAGP